MASPLHLVRSTTEYVVSQSKHVSIVDSAIEKLAQKLTAIPPPKSKWGDYPTHYYKEGSELMAQYVMVLDTLNFCFWPNKTLEYDNLAGPLRDALIKDEHVFDASNLAQMTKEKLVALMGVEFPLIDERVRLLREVGAGLEANFEGRASVMIQRAKGSAAKLVEIMTATFSGFRDHCVYKGRQVFLYKRVQIFVGDIWGAYEGKGLGKFDDIADLTMFPDYRVPQMLEHYEILKYTPALSTSITNNEELPPGSEQEVEIRAASVQAIERLRGSLAKLQQQANLQQQPVQPILSIELDWMMWNAAEADLAHMPPFHRTLTIYY